jgi:hypothetical protein
LTYLGSIQEKLRRRLTDFQQSQHEKRRLEVEIKQKEKVAFNEAYMKGRVATARVRGAEAGRRGGGGTLGKAWNITQKIGKGFIGTAEAMYPEYSRRRQAPHKTAKRSGGTTIRVNGTTTHVSKSGKKHAAKKKTKRDPLDLLGW